MVFTIMMVKYTIILIFIANYYLLIIRLCKVIRYNFTNILKTTVRQLTI